jgi:HlyD family secretion protein
MSSLKWGIGVGLSLLVGIGAFAANQSKQLEKSSEAIAESVGANPKGNFRGISALGRVSPEGETIRVGGPSGARIAELIVREGQFVQKDDPIAILDSYAERDAELELAANQVLEAQQLLETEGDLAEVQAQEAVTRLQQSNLPKQQAIFSQEAAISKLKAELAQANLEVSRYSSLVSKGAATRQVLEDRRLLATQKKEELIQAQSFLEQLKQEQKTSQENIAAQIRSIEALSNRSQAQVQLNSALSRMDLAEVRKGQSVIRAPISGQVIKVFLRNGESIEPTMGEANAGQTIVELGRTQQMYVIAEVYETDVKQLKRGMRASIESDAFEGSIDGVVDRIGLKVGKNDVLNTDPAAATDARVVEVKIRLGDSRKVASLTNLQVDVMIHGET